MAAKKAAAQPSPAVRAGAAPAPDNVVATDAASTPGGETATTLAEGVEPDVDNPAVAPPPANGIATAQYGDAGIPYEIDGQRVSRADYVAHLRAAERSEALDVLRAAGSSEANTPDQGGQ